MEMDKLFEEIRQVELEVQRERLNGARLESERMQRLLDKVPSAKSEDLRDYFAGQVLSGQWEGRFPEDMREPANVERVAQTCYALADAMLRARAQELRP